MKYIYWTYEFKWCSKTTLLSFLSINMSFNLMYDICHIYTINNTNKINRSNWHSIAKIYGSFRVNSATHVHDTSQILLKICTYIAYVTKRKNPKFQVDIFYGFCLATVLILDDVLLFDICELVYSFWAILKGS